MAADHLILYRPQAAPNIPNLGKGPPLEGVPALAEFFLAIIKLHRYPIGGSCGYLQPLALLKNDISVAHFEASSVGRGTWESPNFSTGRPDLKNTKTVINQ